MFKVQQEKIIFKKYLDNIENCTTARAYPDLLNVPIISFRVLRRLHRLSIIIVMNLEIKIHLQEASTTDARLLAFLFQPQL